MAKGKREIDYSVRLRYKDGTVKEYSCLEDAAMDSGLTAASIKIRANNGTVGKDNTACEWLNDSTQRHFMG